MKGCGGLLDEEGFRSCSSCRAKNRQARKDRLRNGMCTTCGYREIDDTTTQCFTCAERTREHNRLAHFSGKWSKVRNDIRTNAKKANGGKVNKLDNKIGLPSSIPRPPRLLPWIHSDNCRSVIGFIEGKREVVDLFAGSGHMSVLAHQMGHHVVAVNDVHPGVVAFFETLQTHPAAKFYAEVTKVAAFGPVELVDAYRKSLSNGRKIRRAALTYIMARSNTDLAALEVPEVKSPTPFNTFRSLASNLKVAMLNAEITRLDFRKAIRQFDGPNRLFICDPPWPQAEKFEFEINGRHDQLIDRLNAAEGDYVVITSSSRESLLFAAKAPHLYWRQGIRFSREIIASSFPLPEVYFKPIDLAAFGLEGSTRSESE